MQYNNLMCMSIGSLLSDPYQWGVLRSAGTRGAHIFEELTEADKVPLYVEMKTHATSDADDINCMNGESIVATNKDDDAYCSLLGDPHHAPLLFSFSVNVDELSKPIVRLDAPYLLIVVSYTPMMQRDMSLKKTVRSANLKSVRIRCDSSVTYIEGGEDLNGPFDVRWGPHCIELSGFENVHTIHDEVFSEYENMDEICLGPLSKVTSIGNDCLFWCKALQSIDLTPFANVTRIGDSFASGCDKLTTIDITPFSHVASIGAEFLSGCLKLVTITVNSSTFLNMVEISDFFASECSDLKELDTSSFINVRVIGGQFIRGCKSIKTLDITPFRNVTSCGTDFINHCSDFTTAESRVPFNELSAALLEAIDNSSASLIHV